MANFDSGVSRYIKTRAVVEVGFPVDWRGSVEIACKHCPYLSSNERICQLNKQPVAYPNKYVGAYCPLEKLEENMEDFNNESN
jgi:hypothetical protein